MRRFKTDSPRIVGSYAPSTGKKHARRGQPWSVAEDRLLRRLTKKHKHVQLTQSRRGYEACWLIAKELGRTGMGVMARIQILRVIDAHQRVERLRRQRRSR